MRFKIGFIHSTSGDLKCFRIYEQRIIIEGIKRYLREDADIESKRRKQLNPNELAPWELKIGNYRVFYDFEGDSVVKIIAIGFKYHKELYIRGRRVTL